MTGEEILAAKIWKKLLGELSYDPNALVLGLVWCLSRGQFERNECIVISETPH